MQPYDRTPEQDPLNRAAREINAYADDDATSFEDTLDWLGIPTTPSELAYLAQQRALRACAADWWGANIGANGKVEDERLARKVIGDDRWPSVSRLLIAAYIDGFAIGWKGNQLADPGRFGVGAVTTAS